LLAALLLIVASCTTGCRSTGTNQANPAVEQRSITPSQAALVAGAADAILLEAVAACHDLASHKYIVEYYQDDRGLAPPHRVLTTLRRTVTRLDAVPAYLLAEDGIVVASTDPGAVDQQFGDWYSFSTAMTSGVRVLPTISVAKRRRAFVISTPVRNADDSITGVVVLLHGGNAVKHALESYSSPTAFVFRDRYAIATNTSGRVLAAVAAVPPGEETGAIGGDLLELLDGLVPIGDSVVVDGRAYTLHRVPSRLPDWALIYGTPLRGDVGR
jgi:C4-dicarboxylate-specific signal transduction histidine kinase